MTGFHRYRFWLAAAALIAFGAGPAGSAGETLPGPQRALLLDVVDGDTIRARARIWLGMDVEILVRLDGIDAPELRGKCPQERALAALSRQRVESLAAGRELLLRDIRYGKYAGRVLARVESGGRDIGATLIAEGLARVYRGGPRPSWCPGGS